MKSLITMALLTVSFSSFAQMDAAHKEKMQELKAKKTAMQAEVHKACDADFEKAGCKDKEFGKGLMKCLKEKKAELSADCQKVMDSHKEQAKEMRAEHKAIKMDHMKMMNQGTASEPTKTK